MSFTPKGYQQITDLSSSVGLAVPSEAQYAVIQCTAQAVRWTDEGTTPTATVGMRLPVNTDKRYDGQLSALEFIEEVGGAVLNVTYYG